MSLQDRDSDRAAGVDQVAVRPDPLSGRELAAFVAVLESGSVQSGAERLNLTQSAATKRIQALERRLGLKLFVRGRFGVRPTDAGTALLPDARLALSALGRAEASAEGLRNGTQRLRLAASHTIGGYLLVRWLDDSQLFVRKARTSLELINSPSVLALVSAGEADVGFIEGPESVDGFDAITMRRDEIRVVVASDHAWATTRTPVTVRDLETEPYIAREQGSGTRTFADHTLEGCGVVLRPAFEVGSVEVIKQAVVAGEGFALMSTLTVEKELREGKLALLSVDGVRIERHLRAVRQRGVADFGVAHRFWIWLSQNAKDGLRSDRPDS